MKAAGIIVGLGVVLLLFGFFLGKYREKRKKKYLLEHPLAPVLVLTSSHQGNPAYAGNIIVHQVNEELPVRIMLGPGAPGVFLKEGENKILVSAYWEEQVGKRRYKGRSEKKSWVMLEAKPKGQYGITYAIESKEYLWEEMNETFS